MGAHRSERRLAVALLAVAFAAFEWPVLLHPMSSAWGMPGGDFGQTLWNFWVTARELGAGHSPWTTDALFAGRPSSLFYHTLNLSYFLAMAPVYLATGSEFLAYNLSHLMAAGLALVCFYRLARGLGARRAMAVLGAVCFAYSPYYLRRLTTLNIESIWLVAFYGLCLLRLWRKARVRDAVLVGLCVVGFLLASWHYLIFSALATPFLVAWVAGLEPGRRWIDRRRVALGGLALAVCLPVLILYGSLAIRHGDLAGESKFNNPTRIRCSASPFYYVVPGWAERRWMEVIEPWRRPEVFAYRVGRERTLFLGMVALLLMARRFAAPRSLRRHLPALVGALFFFVLSLGPALVVFAPVAIGGDRMILLPGNWLHQLPVFSSIRHVTRFGLMVLFFLLLVATTQGGRPSRPLSGRLTQWGTLAVVIALLGAHVADMHAFAKRRDAWRPSRELREALRAEGAPEGFAMVLPAFEWQTEGLGMYLQTMHGRTLAAGYLSRDPDAEIYGTAPHRRFYGEVVERLHGYGPSGAKGAPVPVEDLPALVILDRRRLGLKAGATERLLLDGYPYRKTYGDARLVVLVREKGKS